MFRTLDAFEWLSTKIFARGCMCNSRERWFTFPESVICERAVQQNRETEVSAKSILERWHIYREFLISLQKWNIIFMDHMYIYIRFSRISIKDKYRGNLCRFSQVKSVMKKIPFWEILYALVPGKLHFFLSREITRIPRFAWSSGKSTNLSRLVLKISPLSELCRWSYKVIFHFSVFI